MEPLLQIRGAMDSLNDPEAVRKAYADEKRYTARMAKQETATGPESVCVQQSPATDNATQDEHHFSQL